MGKLNNKGLEMKRAFKQKMKQEQKTMKEVLRAKRAKLIIRNIPFKTNETNLKSLFEQYGEVETVDILKRADGKMIGCAFVQFKLVQNAAKARHYLNGRMFLDRKIEVDFAKAKDKYKKLKQTNTNDLRMGNTEDNIDLSIVKIEDENLKIESEHENLKVESEDEDVPTLENKKTDNTDSDSSECKSDIDMEVAEPKQEKRISNDVSEGKTVFIKNVPFSATNEDLKQCMTQYGPVYYALICIDRLTEHAKGTAFVKFTNQEDAKKCMEAGTELSLHGNVLDCHPALAKHDLLQQEKEKKMKQRDSRNLYLVKEGVILAGTKAAEGVSASDMAKRLQMEQYKTQMLRNLNMYISKTRLIIHNIPPTWNDMKLRTLFKKHSNSNATIKEARIMRDMRNVDSKGIGRSKEYGFVTFTTHDDALSALRSLNNNPTVFSTNKRPIVAFSIENRAALKARERRTQKSILKNPTSKNYNPDQHQKEQSANNRTPEVDDTAVNKNKWTGVNATPGIKKMRSRYNITTQAKLHFEHLKKEKKRTVKTLKEKRKDFIKQPKQKQRKIDDTDSFSILVNKYKQSLKSAPFKKSKWYDTN